MQWYKGDRPAVQPKYNTDNTIHKYYLHTSWTTIVVHSRDDQEVDVAHKVKSPENQPQFSQPTIGQYWLGKTKPKQAFRSTQNAFKKLPRNFKKILFNGIFYWLTN